MVLTDQECMAAAVCIIIILGAIRESWNNRRPVRRSCWVRPWIRRRPQFGAFHALLNELSTEDPPSFRNFFTNGPNKIWRTIDTCFPLQGSISFYTPVSRRVVLCDRVWRAGGHPDRFPHDNFSSVYIGSLLTWPHDSPVEGEEPYLFWAH